VLLLLSDPLGSLVFFKLIKIVLFRRFAGETATYLFVWVSTEIDLLGLAIDCITTVLHADWGVRVRSNASTFCWGKLYWDWGGY
jgi:hypothetical protein